MDEVEQIKQEAARTFVEIEDTLAQANGFPYDEKYGYAIGDHTELSLADMTRRKMIEIRRLVDINNYLFLDSNERLEEIRKLVKDNQEG